MSKKILIIDDDPEIVAYLKEVFDNAGYETQTAVDGDDGLAKARAFKPDLITLDIEMPTKDGTMFYVKKRKDAALEPIPTVVISGIGPKPPSLSKSLPVITKPIDTVKTLKIIADLIGV